MSFGISSASLFPVNTEETLGIMKSLGAEVCELFLETESEYEVSFAQKLKAEASEAGIKPISVHSFCSAFEPFLFTPYDRRREDCVKMFKRVVSAANALGAKYYTFHGCTLREDYDVDEYARIFTRLAEAAKEKNVVLAWENVSWCMSSKPEFIKQILKRVETDNLKCTLDIKQAYRAERKPDDYIKVMGDHLVNVHINDYGNGETCLLPGRGEVDFAELFKRLDSAGYKGDYILEVYRSNYKEPEELKISLEYLKKIYS